MGILKLQEKVRKLKNPLVVDISLSPEQVPPHILNESLTPMLAYGRYYHELLCGLKDVVPAVRLNLGQFSMLGEEGLTLLRDVSHTAKAQGLYVFLDGPECWSVRHAEFAAKTLLSADCPWHFDALVVSAYAGSDVIKPYIPQIKGSGKDLFVVLRTPNKSASELQDLLSGSRLVHIAKANMVSLQGHPMVDRSGYSQIAGVGPASNSDALRNLRSKYPNLFLLVDGLDLPNANAKNCTLAFDKLGRGAVVCAGAGITAAWEEAQSEGRDYVELACQAAERLKKNLLRYITIL